MTGTVTAADVFTDAFVVLLLVAFALVVAWLTVAGVMKLTDTQPYEVRNWIDRTRLNRRVRKTQEKVDRIKNRRGLDPDHDEEYEQARAAHEDAVGARGAWTPRPEPARHYGSVW